MSGAVVAAVVALVVCAASEAAGAARVFYLSVHVHQCLIASTNQRAKTVAVVPCSNPKHNMEVYAIGHGGWGHHNPPSDAYSLARAVCLSAYRRVTGHALATTAGWQGSWPDPGAETTRYGDKLVCSFRSWPKFAALGSGWHVH